MIKFYLLIATELLFFPLLVLWEELKKVIDRFNRQKSRVGPVLNKIDNQVVFVVHEWSGYDPVRKKRIKNGVEFLCGLQYQLERLLSYKGRHQIRKMLTISDFSDTYIDKLKDYCSLDEFEIVPVRNNAMDFSGYSYVCKNLIDQNREQVIFLTNSSIAGGITEFIDQYYELFRLYPDLGLLGVSYSTKIYQSLIRNNFYPHIQSFFLATKTSVLKRVIKKNHGSFPGENEDYKLSIIRFGEIKLTRIVQQLGYKVAVIPDSGKLYFFPNCSFFYNGFKSWELPYGDYRLHSKYPNGINSIDLGDDN